jgi:hypothetical protein
VSTSLSADHGPRPGLSPDDVPVCLQPRYEFAPWDGSRTAPVPGDSVEQLAEPLIARLCVSGTDGCCPVPTDQLDEALQSVCGRVRPLREASEPRTGVGGFTAAFHEPHSGKGCVHPRGTCGRHCPVHEVAAGLRDQQVVRVGGPHAGRGRRPAVRSPLEPRSTSPIGCAALCPQERQRLDFGSVRVTHSLLVVNWVRSLKSCCARCEGGS